MHTNLVGCLLLLLMAAVAIIAAVGYGSGRCEPPLLATGQSTTKPASNLDYWLSAAEEVSSKPTTQPTNLTTTNAAHQPRRTEALPGVIELSDGTIMPGWVYTTRQSPWRLWDVHMKRWRLIPPIAVLSITAVVDEEEIVQQWRWKEMGAPERVYTGREYPTRRFRWRFSLIDGSEIIGEIKGQPVWVELDGEVNGPFILHERSKGSFDQTLDELVYVKRVIISRCAMEKATAFLRPEGKAKPAAGVEEE